MKASDILSIDDLLTKEVLVPGWNKTLTIRELGLDEGIKLFSLARGSDENLVMDSNAIAQVIAWGVIDANGERIFSDDDVPEIAKKGRAPLMFLYREITSLSGNDAEKN